MNEPKNIENQDFEIPQQLYDNFLPDELVLYTLKTSWGTNLIITNKRIYKFTMLTNGQIESVESVDLNSINLVTFKKRSQLSDFGTIEIFSNTLKFKKKNKITIKGVQNLSNTVNLIESIVWHYGNIKERLDRLNTEKKIRIPHDFKLNTELWIKLNRSKKKLSLLIIISVISIIIGIINLIFGTIHYMFSVFIFDICSLLLLISLIRKYTLMRILSPQRNLILRLKEKELVLLEDQFSISFQFNPNLYITAFRFVFTETSSENFVGGIKIKKTFEDTEELKFGPIFDFLNFVDYIFLYILLWKSQMRYLMSKEKLSKVLKESPIRKIEKIEQNSAQNPPIIEKNEKILFEQYDQSADIFKEFLNYLNSKEKILLFYKPILLEPKKYIFIFIIMLISIIVLVSMPFFDYPLGLLWLIFLLAFPSFMCSTLYIVSVGPIVMKSSFVFTDQKIIAKYSYRYLLIPYNNISSIIKRDKKKIYDIVINVKSTLKESPFRKDKQVIIIDNIPKEKDLMTKIKQFKDLYS